MKDAQNVKTIPNKAESVLKITYIKTFCCVSNLKIDLFARRSGRAVIFARAVFFAVNNLLHTES